MEYEIKRNEEHNGIEVYFDEKPGMKSQIDRDRTSYKEKCAKNRENGSLGGKANATERYRTLPNATERPPNAPQGH